MFSLFEQFLGRSLVGTGKDHPVLDGSARDPDSRFRFPLGATTVSP